MPAIRAAVARATGQPLELLDLHLDEPQPDEVLVRMVATGLCHTDLTVRDTVVPPALPAILGHEGAGVVEKVGAAATGISVGDRVALSFASCGDCKACRGGHPAHCASFIDLNMSGTRRDGTSTLRHEDGTPIGGSFFSQSSFATHALAHASNVVKIRPQDDLELVGPLGCGVQTGAGTVINVLRPAPGSSLVVFGVGGVGMSAALAALAVGCTTVVAVDVNAERLQLAKELGVTAVLDPTTDDVLAELTALNGGVDYAVDTTGRATIVKTALEALAPGGVLALHGLYTPDGEGLDVAAIPAGKSVVSVIEGDSVPQTTIPALLALHEAGHFPFDRLITFYDFDNINEAIADMESGRTIKPVIRFPA
ncbi:NAD(P)-dependent alcohol dehydrogenase [Georgenia sp. AZ-5]|uniref:NAD(P)-dependent alcohol dehydrogenase n=1 Tax=Georgenia sp. AZ-5 TaxID=3367526 RepID=UPI0037551C31